MKNQILKKISVFIIASLFFLQQAAIYAAAETTAPDASEPVVEAQESAPAEEAPPEITPVEGNSSAASEAPAQSGSQGDTGMAADPSGFVIPEEEGPIFATSTDPSGQSAETASSGPETNEGLDVPPSAAAGTSTEETAGVSDAAGPAEDLESSDAASEAEEDRNEAEAKEIIDLEKERAGNPNVGNYNGADVSNDVNIDSQTGANEISNSGTSTIKSGDIGIINVLLNYVNNNFIGQGKQLFLDIIDKVFGDIDLSGFAGGTPPADGPQNEVFDLSTGNVNVNKLDNNLVIRADTGENIIASSTGNNTIETGDIDIANDIINIANLNVAGDDWFFAVVNIMGELNGDLILPALEAGETSDARLAEVLDENYREARRSMYITNKNFSDTANQINIDANTGENEVAGGGSIETGNIHTKTNAFNLINYNFIGNKWQYIRINIFGNWDGVIHGLPEGYDYFEDETGVTIYSDQFKYGVADLFAEVYNANYSDTANNIDIYANTGRNSIEGGEGEISTGDISIRNNLVNFINSNFIGNNWQFSLINVFGDWHGNLSFGQADLWITESVSTSTAYKTGDVVNYIFLFGNKGDATAKSVAIANVIDENLLSADEQNGLRKEAGKLIWDIGDLPPDTQGSISLALKVKDIPAGTANAANTATISGEGSDRNPGDNTVGGIIALSPGSGGGGSGGGNSGSGSSGGSSGSWGYNIAGNSAQSGLTMIKTNDAGSAVGPGSKVAYKITITNSGNQPIRKVAVTDIMREFTSKTVVSKDYWDLETIDAGETVVIDYIVEIKSGIPSGIYLNEAYAEGLDSRAQSISAVASSKIKVENGGASGYNNGGPLINLSNITKTKLAYPGDIVDFDIFVANNGNSALSNVEVAADIPGDISFTDHDSQTRTWKLGDMPPGSIKKVSYALEIDSQAKEGAYGISVRSKADNLPETAIESILKIGKKTAAAKSVQPAPRADRVLGIKDVENIEVLSAESGAETSSALALAIEDAIPPASVTEDSRSDSALATVLKALLFLDILFGIALAVWYFKKTELNLAAARKQIRALFRQDS